MKLIYTGKTLAEVGVVPLPEGWPAADHEEADAGVAAAKLASGQYREAASRREGRGKTGE